jgi:hypothetical protein
MGGSSLPLGGLRNDFLKKIGGRLNWVPTPQHHWQLFLGREYDILSRISFVFCERDLGWDSYFFHSNQKATFF